MQVKKSRLSFVGKSIRRVDALEKIEGKAVYGDDFKIHGMLYAVCVRSSYPKARVKKIDISKVENDENFVRLIKPDDIPGSRFWPLVDNDYPFLSYDVEFESQPIALLVAKTYFAAKELARKVKVEYEPLKPCFDIFESIKNKENIFSNYKIKKGNPFEELKKCKYVVEDEFVTNYQVHSYLETQVATAIYEKDDNMTVYSSTQCPFYVLDAVCAICGLKSNKVKVIQTVVGGGFGGKEDVPALVASHAAVASYLIKKPVRVVYDRVEDFKSMSKRHPSYSKVIYGADENGKIKVCIVKYILDAGAYSTLSPIVLWRGTVHATGPYNIKNVFIESYAVKTNKVPCGAFRGFGQPQISFAQESLIDDLADKIKMDPIDFRLKNILDKNLETATSQKIKESIGLREAINIVRKKSNWDFKRKNKNNNESVLRGTGCSVVYYGVGLGAKGRYLDRAGAYINIYRDGSVSVSVGNVEMGQGALTVLSQIAAEMLNCPIENVKMENVDTSKVPDSGPTVASRTTLMSGNAIIEAARPLRERIFKIASDILKSKNIIAADGFFIYKNKKIGFNDVIKECWTRRIKMSEQGWYVAPPTSFDINNGKGDAYVVYSYSANVVDVSIDIDTGIVNIEKVYSVLDAGKMINPKLCKVQAQGGILQGIGWACYENLVVENGIILNPSFNDYVLPTSMDIPEYFIDFIEKPYSKGPYMAKGIGELPLIGIAGCIRNAIKNAIGIKINYLPFIPEKNLKLIKELK